MRGIMLQESQPIAKIVDDVYHTFIIPHDLTLRENPFENNKSGIRPHSASVEDCSLGDSGKGHAVQEFNDFLLSTSDIGTLFSLRYNGTRNAGHEIVVHGVRVALHQLPVAVTQEGATGIMGKGMLVHPTDLATEIRYVENSIGAKLPGTLWVDSNAVVTTDLHSAYETFTNKKLDVGHGATGSGVAQGYSSWYEKRAMTVRDLMNESWRDEFAKQYEFYASLMGADTLSQMPVNALTEDGKRMKRNVGTKEEFLDRLEETRMKLRPYVQDVRPKFEDVWKHQLKIPVTFEGAQGGLLDPYHGVYPDVTASRPIARIGIPDSTEGVVIFDSIAVKVGVLKEPYMSSVGSRVHPYEMAPDIASKYRKENDETGRSTGRDRGIYPIDLVAMRHIRKVAGYNFTFVTHLDSNHKDRKIEIVTQYVNKVTGQIEGYRPYQWHWNQVEGVVAELPSWDGKEVGAVTNIDHLPQESQKFLQLVSEVLAPVVMATNGSELGKRLLFFPHR